MLAFSQSLLDAFPAGVLLTDSDRVVRQLNRWLRDRLGQAAAEMLDKPLHLAIPDLDERGLLPAYDLVRHRLTRVSLPASTYRYFIRLPADPEIGLSEMPQAITLVPIVVDGDFAGTLTIIEDLTDRRVAELQLQREIDKLTALHVIDHALATLDLAACLQIIIDRTRALFQAENAALLLLQGNQLAVAADAGYPQSYVGHRIGATDGITGWTVSHKRSVLVPDVRAEPRFIQVDPRILSEMTTPLMLRDECLGALNVESRRLNAFSEADLDLLETLGARAAVAIHNARLHAAEHEQRVLAETLRDVTLTLASELNPEAILDGLLDHVVRVTPYDTACILLYDPQLGRVHIDRSRGYDRLGLAAEARAFSADLADLPSLDRIRQTRAPWVIADASVDPLWVRTKLSYHIRAWAGAPIVARGQLLGFLSLDKLEPNFYTARMAGHLATFAAAAGLALENARLYAEQQRLAITDGLTGLANRRHFDHMLARELSRSARFGRALSVILLDIDNFKQYNDAYGHLAGDDMLKRLGRSLSETVRSIDSLARYGGEEFVVILPETSGAEACTVAERLREATLALNDNQQTVTLSLGVADNLRPNMTAADLLAAADSALYHAKRTGKNRVVLHADSSPKDATSRL